MSELGGLPTEPLPPAAPPQRVNKAPAKATAPKAKPKTAAKPPAPTRGRPNDVPAIAATEEDGYVDDGLSRRSLAEGEGNNFEIPKALERRGWVYQWFATHVVGQPVDNSEIAFANRQGWRPCTDPAIRAHFCGPTWARPTVEAGGMLLMTRPERLNKEAAREMREKAERQKRDKLQQALAAPMDQHPSMPRRVTENVIEGEVGAYATDPTGRG